MGFLSGLARGLQGALGGDRLAIAQAILAGDYQGAAALHARQAELQRQNEARDAQVVGAKHMGFSNDEIAAMNAQQLSEAARQRAAARMFGGGGAEGEGDGAGQAPPAAAPQLAPGGAAPIFAPPPGMPPAGMPPSGISYMSASGRFLRPPAGGSLPRANTHGQAAALPRGAFFLAPDGSIRRNF